MAIGSPSIVRQCLQAGLLDEIRIKLVPSLFFRLGEHLFEPLDIPPLDLEIAEVTLAPGVVYLTFRVKK